MQQELARLGGQLQELHGRMERQEGQIGEAVACKIREWAESNGIDGK